MLDLSKWHELMTGQLICNRLVQGTKDIIGFIQVQDQVRKWILIEFQFFACK